MNSKIKALYGLGIFSFALFIILMIISILTSNATGNYQSETNLYFFGSIIPLLTSIVIYAIIQIEKNQHKKRMVYLTRESFSELVKQTTLQNQDGKCNMCNMPLHNYVIEYDHIDNDKTNNQLSNCQALCVNCHSKKIRQDRGYSK
tara:strand:+ start:747 stop:1184 length:438 start_codon:yes stop_codon:yes gene_type:complete